MKCPGCGFLESKVTDSRQTEDGMSIRRRRECIKCGKRFTTYETIETTPILVQKNSGVIQPFDVGKIKNGIIKACEKRPVTSAQIDDAVRDVTRKIQNSLTQDVTSKQIGEYVMEALKKMDEVAYVRYASVHRKFKDIESFLGEIESLLKDKGEHNS